jgi:hypothetical protein
MRQAGNKSNQTGRVMMERAHNDSDDLSDITWRDLILFAGISFVYVGIIGAIGVTLVIEAVRSLLGC